MTDHLGMSDDDDDGPEGPDAPKRDYEVGYGRPPKHSQFKRGEVNNPKGKPKGRRSLKTEAREVLAMPVSINTGDGRVRKVSTQRASMMKLREMAIKGDIRAIDRLIEFGRQFDIEEPAPQPSKELQAERLKKFVEELAAEAADHYGECPSCHCRFNAFGKHILVAAHDHPRSW